MKYVEPQIDNRLYGIKSALECLHTIDKVGINHNHNSLFIELFNTKTYKKAWNTLRRNEPEWPYGALTQTIREEIKSQMWAIEDKIKAKSPDPYKTEKFPDDINLNLLKQILALSAKHLYPDLHAHQNVNNFEEHLQSIHNSGYAVFRFGINKCNSLNFLPMLEGVFNLINSNSLKHYNNNNSTLAEKKGDWDAIRSVGSMESLWGCVEGGLVSHGEFIAYTLLDILECPKISDNNERRKVSVYLALGRLYLGVRDKKKAYRIFSKIPPLMARFENPNPHRGFIFWRSSQTRCVEAAIEVYKLRRTAKNRSLCNELYLRSLFPYFSEGQDSDAWEAVRERIIITLMLIKYVYNEEV